MHESVSQNTFTSFILAQAKEPTLSEDTLAQLTSTEAVQWSMSRSY